MIPSIKETLDSVFTEGGYKAIIQYFIESEKLSLEDATKKAKEYISEHQSEDLNVESDEDEYKVELNKGNDNDEYADDKLGKKGFGPPVGYNPDEHTHADHHPEESKKNTGGQE